MEIKDFVLKIRVPVVYIKTQKHNFTPRVFNLNMLGNKT